jgi:hypothetical protein
VYISSLQLIPGFQVNRYLGIINLFLIRESTSIREVSHMNGQESEYVKEGGRRGGVGGGGGGGREIFPSLGHLYSLVI